MGNDLQNYFSRFLNIYKEGIDNQFKDNVFNIKIGDHSIRLHFSSDVLISKLLPAFEHILIENNSEAQLTIYLVDRKATGINLPTTPWVVTPEEEDGEIIVSSNNDIKVHQHVAWKNLSMVNLATNEAIYWVDDASQIRFYESSSPLRNIFQFWMTEKGCQLLHAGAVGLPGKGVLLVGKSGSGKSNTALSCVDSKLYYASDDYSLLSFESEPTINSIYSTGKLHFKDIDKFPHLLSTNYAGDKKGVQDEKALFFLNRKYAARITKSFPIKAIFIPKITNNKVPKLVPVSAAEGYLSLAPSTIFQIRGDRRQAHKNMSALLKQVPCFRLELSTELEKNPEMIYDYLNKLEA